VLCKVGVSCAKVELSVGGVEVGVGKVQVSVGVKWACLMHVLSFSFQLWHSKFPVSFVFVCLMEMLSLVLAKHSPFLSLCGGVLMRCSFTTPKAVHLVLPSGNSGNLLSRLGGFKDQVPLTTFGQPLSHFLFVLS
jgi:hypothetical protein